MASGRLRITWIMAGANLTGGVKTCRLMAEAMHRRGHEVAIAYSARGRPWPKPWRAQSLAKRAWAAWTDRGPKQHHLMASTATVLPIPRRVIRPQDVPDADVVIATWWETAEWIRDWPRSKGAKAYYIQHHEVFGGDPERVKASYRLPYKKFVVAKWLQRIMAEEYGDATAALITYGIDRAQFDSPPRKRNHFPRIGFLAGRAPWKGTPTALEAARIVQRTMPHVQVVAFGWEVVPPQFALPANFEFHLRPPQDRIPELHRSTDCWVVSSTSEGFGLPGLEAAACRCPLVSTRCGGPEDYVREGENGYLVDVGDAQSMAERILDILTGPEEQWMRLSENSWQISREFDWDKSAEELENTLLSFVSRA